ncbi:MAG: glycoside hydrolase family 16 protein [Mariniphaga sp.]
MREKIFQQACKHSIFRHGIFKLVVISALLVATNMGMVFASNIKGVRNKERIISFSGFEWLVKSSVNSKLGTLAPGNNYFSDSEDNVWVDKNGWLHLKITHKKGKWYCAEVILTKPLGYKKYIFHVIGRIDQFQQNVVGGFFTYLDGTDNAEEIDIEFSKWNGFQIENPSTYGIQPTDSLGNTKRFSLNLSGDNSTHLFDWQKGKVDFASYHGHYLTPPDSTYIINKWSYSGRDVPIDPNGKIHINLWLFRRNEIKPSDPVEAEMVIRNFQAL